MEDMTEFQIPEDALNKLKDPEILRRQVEQGKTFQEIIGYSDDTMQKFYSAAYHLFQREQYKESADAFIFLTTLNPYVHNYWLGLGMCEQKEGRFQDALLAYGMAVLTDPSDPITHYHSAFCYKSLRDEAKAVLSLNMAVSCAEEKPEYQTIKNHALAAKKIWEN